MPGSVSGGIDVVRLIDEVRVGEGSIDILVSDGGAIVAGSALAVSGCALDTSGSVVAYSPGMTCISGVSVREGMSLNSVMGV